MASTGPIQLTTMIVSPSDLKRARREVESIDDAMHQAGLRSQATGTADTTAGKLLPSSRLIDELSSETHLDVAKAAERAQLLKYLTDLVEHAPVLHFSFASEPSAAFMNKLIIWLRTNIHPQVLVHLGLQPSVVAGCVMRTANRQFDFSLNSAFEAQRDLLINSLTEVTIATATSVEAKKVAA